MVTTLKMALDLNARMRASEVVVSKNVLQDVLRLVDQMDRSIVRLNIHQNNPNYPFVHKVKWKGILFVHLSHVAIPSDSTNDAGTVSGK